MRLGPLGVRSRAPRGALAALGTLSATACGIFAAMPAVPADAAPSAPPAVGADASPSAPAALARRPHHSATTVVGPRSDARAAALVERAAESRPDNAADNRRVPTQALLDHFRRRNDALPARYLDRVDGDFRGSTDEIIQWAAYKWGFEPDLLRAVAAVESWWHMSTRGDEGHAFGLFQVDARYHCCRRLAARYSAWNADYYGAMLRSYFDGAQTWLNTVSGNGSPYRAGELWASVGYWAAGRWQTPTGRDYVAKVRADLAERVWTRPDFNAG